MRPRPRRQPCYRGLRLGRRRMRQMVDVLSSDDWGRALGLAVSPLFSQGDAPANGRHSLLLNGADGCMAFSAYNDHDGNGPFLDWAWSSGVLHHLSVSPNRV